MAQDITPIPTIQDGLIRGIIRCGDFYKEYACTFLLLTPAVIKHLFQQIGDAIASEVERHLQEKLTDEKRIGHA